VIKLVAKKDTWDELDSKLYNLMLDFQEWEQSFQELIEGRITINSQSILRKWSIQDLLKIAERDLMDFKKYLRSLESIKIRDRKEKARVKKTEKRYREKIKTRTEYQEFEKHSGEVLKLFGQFLERSINND
jgi:hypothetical protein